MIYLAIINTIIIVVGAPLVYRLSDTFKHRRAMREFDAAHKPITDCEVYNDVD